MKKINKVFKIGMSKKKGEKINEINEIEVLSGKGILGDNECSIGFPITKKFFILLCLNIPLFVSLADP